jgi:hypothetical protein
MTWTPIWNVTIDGISYTNYVLANLKITSGRTNIYEQAQAGYCNIQLINLDHSLIPYQINDTISISLENSAGNFIPIFGGSIVDLGVEVAQSGSVDFTQYISITALGALARLPKVLTDGVLAKDFDGDQIYTILQGVLFAQWQQVPAATQWNTYDPAITWANAFNTGLGEIDRPGNYELAKRSTERTNVYSLVSALATSGLGYIYENSLGQISYADSDHRSTYLSLNGYTDLHANHALAAGLRIQTRAGDVRNNLTLKYGETSSAEISASDGDSITLFGELSQIITTTLEHSADATDQADFYLLLRAYPQPIFDSITYELTNQQIEDINRDALIAVFMGMPVSLSDLPTNMSSGSFQGFVEGWTFSAGYNSISVTLNLSPLSFSLQAMRWNSVPITESWNTITPTLEWQYATIVA